MTKRLTQNQKGFTLIEILVVMGILSILSTLGYLVTIDFYRSYAFNAERDTVVSILQKARSLSLSNISQTGHGVHFNPNEYVIFQGAIYDSTSLLNQKIATSPGINNSGAVDVIFSQLSGNSNYIGNINLTDGKRNAVISLNSEGQINW